MSKTTGNVVDPLGIIDSTGADALRFALIHGATPGLDQRFGEAKVENARNFANKLWNATRFVLGARPASIAADAPRGAPDVSELGLAERWIRSRAAATVDAVDGAMASFQFAEVTRFLYDAIWTEFCDWGIELAKTRLGDETLSTRTREATWWTLVETLDTYLRLLHPVMPFVTEALWGSLPHGPADPGLLIVADWPGAGPVDGAADGAVGSFVALVHAIRNARAEAAVEAGAWLGLDVVVPAELEGAFEALAPALERLGRARPLRLMVAGPDVPEPRPGELVVLADGVEARIAAVADPGQGIGDRARLERELAEATTMLEAAEQRLANAEFVSKAPPAVVENARVREAELRERVARLAARLEA